MQIGAHAKRRAPTPTIQWYSATAALHNETWAFSLGFDSGTLRHVSFAPVQPQASWNTFSEAEEKRVAVDLQRLLASWLPGVTAESRQTMQRYTLPWGTIAAGIVPQDATASMSMLYSPTGRSP
jgi:hypothetical protein